MDRVKLALMGLGDPGSLARVLLDHIPEGMSLSREHGTIVYTNPAKDRLFVYAPRELLGQPVLGRSAYVPEEEERLTERITEEIARSAPGPASGATGAGMARSSLQGPASRGWRSAGIGICSASMMT